MFNKIPVSNINIIIYLESKRSCYGNLLKLLSVVTLQNHFSENNLDCDVEPNKLHYLFIATIFYLPCMLILCTKLIHCVTFHAKYRHPPTCCGSLLTNQILYPTFQQQLQ